MGQASNGGLVIFFYIDFFFAGAFLAGAFLAIAFFFDGAFLAAGFRLAMMVRFLVECRDRLCRDQLGSGSYQSSAIHATADFWWAG